MIKSAKIWYFQVSRQIIRLFKNDKGDINPIKAIISYE